MLPTVVCHIAERCGALLQVTAIDPTVERAVVVPGPAGPWIANFELAIPNGEQTFYFHSRI